MCLDAHDGDGCIEEKMTSPKFAMHRHPKEMYHSEPRPGSEPSGTSQPSANWNLKPWLYCYLQSWWIFGGDVL